MRDAIQRPEPTGWAEKWRPSPDSNVKTIVWSGRPYATNGTESITPLYTRADVIAWAKAVIEDTLVACECGQSGCYVCAGDSAVCQALNTLDDAAREWEAEND